MADRAESGWLARFWHWLWLPAVHWPWLTLVIIGLALGVIGSGITAGALIYTSSNAFCTSCHENNVVPEWKKSVHYVNAVGFTAGCADCHEPRDPIGMVLRKIAGFNEVYHQVIGTISTPEKFEAHRLELAEKVWTTMRANNSENCRGCHDVSQMNDPAKSFLPPMHRTAIANGQACIDCHKGVAHKAPTQTAAVGGNKS